MYLVAPKQFSYWKQIFTNKRELSPRLPMGFRPPHLAALRRAYFTGWSPSLRENRLLFPPDRLSIVIPLMEHRYYTLISRRWHGGHSDDGRDHSHVGMDREKAEGIFRLGLAADVFLSVGKALTGYICGSTAIIADAAHSASDVVLSSIALLSYRAAKAPKDNKHPYGHGKFESLGALGISCMLLGTAGGIAWHAFDVLQGVLMSAPDMISHTLDHHNHNHGHGGHHHGFDLDHPTLALSMTLLSISVKEGLYWITKRAGEKQGSGLMKANAWHHRADAVSSVVALIGVGGSLIGVPFVDPLAGIVVAGMIFKAGIESGYQSVMELVDAGAPQSVLAPIRQTINQVEDVKGCHRLRGRKAGSFLYLDVHIEVDPFLSVSAAHDIGETVRQIIQKTHHQVAEVFVHIDPSYSHNSMSDRRPSSKNLENQDTNISKQQEAEAVVSHVISSLFQEKMTVEHIILHKFGENILLQVQVSIPPEKLIQEAINMAREAEKEILKAASNINEVSILLRLGHPIQGTI
ncbi:metal tolerance protein 2 [Phalaenopsis equestris]|uniref:metal tolerance protein 2 n=1 Tax=Phalaenopsis equestris TaxID=78828 RepID=UPI0009E501DE|nr:metal tolerance protein 2 [Phalaenopsis equestris]